MEFVNCFASGKLVKSVNILGNDCQKFSRFFEFGKLFVRRIRFDVRNQHLILVEPIEFLRVMHKERMADDLFRRILILHVVKTVL